MAAGVAWHRSGDFRDSDRVLGQSCAQDCVAVFDVDRPIDRQPGGDHSDASPWVRQAIDWTPAADTLRYPSFVSSSENSESTVGSHVVDLLCTNRTLANLLNEMPHSTTTLVTLFLLQTGISYGFIGFYTLGLTYVDDNAVEHTAPALIGELNGRRVTLTRENIYFGMCFRCCVGWQIFGISVRLQFVAFAA